jgi:hypothetical protein
LVEGGFLQTGLEINYFFFLEPHFFLGINMLLYLAFAQLTSPGVFNKDMSKSSYEIIELLKKKKVKITF